METPLDDRPILLFDGHCNVCNGSVKFILRHESKPTILFCSLQSAIGNELLTKHGIVPSSIDSVVLLHRGFAFTHFSAVLEIAKELGGFFRLILLFRILPRPIRDALYRLFARSRYTLFGRSTSCLVPSPAIRDRFLG